MAWFHYLRPGTDAVWCNTMHYAQHLRALRLRMAMQLSRSPLSRLFVLTKLVSGVRVAPAEDRPRALPKPETGPAPSPASELFCVRVSTSAHGTRGRLSRLPGHRASVGRAEPMRLGAAHSTGAASWEVVNRARCAPLRPNCCGGRRTYGWRQPAEGTQSLWTS